MRIDEIYVQKCNEPSDINEHLPVLKEYASRCESVTEFGVRSIVSTWALIAGRPKKVISYDQTSPGDWAIEEVKKVASEAGVEFEFRLANVLHVSIQDTDLLFIDTFHTYYQLRSELMLHAPFAQKWIILHDTETFGLQGEAGSEMGLTYAIDEYVRKHAEWRVAKRFTNNNGLTIMERVENAG